MIFSYDESGAPIAIHYRLNGSAEDVFYTYYLEKNLQGDIIALYNASGTKLVGYTYDAWGNCTTTYYNNGGSTGAQFNPFRYRGYYYDTGLELYYLNSRYYDCRTGRFINSDSLLDGGVGLLSYNMFAYCNNNPIMFIDPNGTSFWTWLVNLFGGNKEEEYVNNFSNDSYTPPQKMNPGNDFSDYYRDYSDYYLVNTQTYTHTISSSQAQSIQNKTEANIGINKFVKGLKSSITGAILTYACPALGYAITAIEIFAPLGTNEVPNIANGTYTTVVALYENSKGQQMVVTRTYSDLISDYNTDWTCHGYYSGTGLENYGKIKSSIPIKYP